MLEAITEKDFDLLQSKGRIDLRKEITKAIIDLCKEKRKQYELHDIINEVMRPKDKRKVSIKEKPPLPSVSYFRRQAQRVGVSHSETRLPDLAGPVEKTNGLTMQPNSCTSLPLF